MRPADTTQFISFPSDLEGTFLLDEPLPALDESLETPRPSRKKEKRQPLQNAPINIPSISPICTKERLDEQDPTLVNTKHQSFDPPQQSLLIEVPTTKVTTVRRRKAVASSLNIEPTQRFASPSTHVDSSHTVSLVEAETAPATGETGRRPLPSSLKPRLSAVPTPIVPSTLTEVVRGDDVGVALKPTPLVPPASMLPPDSDRLAGAHDAPAPSAKLSSLSSAAAVARPPTPPRARPSKPTPQSAPKQPISGPSTDLPSKPLVLDPTPPISIKPVSQKPTRSSQDIHNTTKGKKEKKEKPAEDKHATMKGMKETQQSFPSSLALPALPATNEPRISAPSTGPQVSQITTVDFAPPRQLDPLPEVSNEAMAVPNLPSQDVPVLTHRDIPLTFEDVSPIKTRRQLQVRQEEPMDQEIAPLRRSQRHAPPVNSESTKPAVKRKQPSEQSWPSAGGSNVVSSADPKSQSSTSSRFDEYARKMEFWGTSSAPVGSKGTRAGHLLAGLRSTSTLRAQFRAPKVVPLRGGPSNAERRAQERRDFEAWRATREQQREQMAAHERELEEEELIALFKESRKRAIPKANPVPDWYDKVPKRRKLE